MLKVITFSNDTLPVSYSFMSALYVASGDEPVGNPSLNGFSGVGLALLILETM
jgi:hypothetical protein